MADRTDRGRAPRASPLPPGHQHLDQPFPPVGRRRRDRGLHAGRRTGTNGVAVCVGRPWHRDHEVGMPTATRLRPGRSRHRTSGRLGRFTSPSDRPPRRRRGVEHRRGVDTLEARRLARRSGLHHPRVRDLRGRAGDVRTRARRRRPRTTRRSRPRLRGDDRLLARLVGSVHLPGALANGGRTFRPHAQVAHPPSVRRADRRGDDEPPGDPRRRTQLGLPLRVDP